MSKSRTCEFRKGQRWHKPAAGRSVIYFFAVFATAQFLLCHSAVATAKCVAQETSSDEPSLEHQQKNVSQRYRLLEQKLFTLFEYEQDNNPARSKLLKRAYVLSQENGTVEALEKIVALMNAAELKDAETSQVEVLKQLESMLTLLQSEDRGRRIRDELERHQGYLKEVERLLRIQKSLRGQTDGNVDGQRLAKSQGDAAERAKKLSDDIQENEETPVEETTDEMGDDNGERDPTNAPENDSDGSENDENANSENKPRDSDPAEGKQQDGGNESQKKGEKSSDAEKAEDSEGDSGKPDASKPNSGQPNQQGKPSDSKSSQDQDAQQQTQPENPIRKRIQAAEDRMRKAKQNLEQADRKEAVEEMKEAEREIAAAKKELEEILRQLRGEEVERTLAMLEGRFRRMLEREVKILEQTKSLDQIVPEQRQADFEIKAGKISVEQSSVATEASRALLLLREDGSSIAFPQTVAEMQQDMTQVASRLSAAKVGSMTIGIEEDIVETLNYLIEALAKEQKDREKSKQQGQPSKNMQTMDPGDLPLVEQLAELRMLRGLQDRIHRRHTRYSEKLAEPNDIIGTADDPDLRSALERLAEKQKQLTDIAREIVNGINK